jgi:hypothetical protein
MEKILVEAMFVLAEEYFLEGPDDKRHQILKKVVARIVQPGSHGDASSPSSDYYNSFWNETAPIMARVLDRFIDRLDFENTSTYEVMDS